MDALANCVDFMQVIYYSVEDRKELFTNTGSSAVDCQNMLRFKQSTLYDSTIVRFFKMQDHLQIWKTDGKCVG